jgi:hypothetical protein
MNYFQEDAPRKEIDLSPSQVEDLSLREDLSLLESF